VRDRRQLWGCGYGTSASMRLLPLGELPLALGFCPEAPVLVGAVPEVLVPDRGVAPGLRGLLRELGLTLRSGGNSLQTPDDWIRRIHGSPLALVVADREADTWASLRRGPLASRPHRPGTWPDGRPATAGGLKVCASCIDPKLAAPSASGVLPHRFR